MPPDNSSGWFAHWLYTNAPAAWISAIVATIGFVLLFWNRKKALRVVIREIHNTSLLRIWSSMRSRVKVTFRDTGITSLGQVITDIYNDGSEVVRGVSFTLIFPADCKVLDACLTHAPPNSTCDAEGNVVVIGLPYLNPFREHKQVIQLSILVDGKSENVFVSGIGEGWSIRHLPLPTSTQLLLRRLIILAISLIVTLSYISLARLFLGIPEKDFDVREAIVSIPPMLLAVSVMGWLFKEFITDLQRRS